jgi:hypothetical protein
MQTLRIILVIALCILILDSMRVGWVASRPASRSRNAGSQEGNDGKD